jgi:RNA polymerase sigma factor (sigma-70 family)
MGASNGEYPRDLGAVIGHAKRLMKVLAKIERVRSDAWFRGRAGELRGVVSLALADWRSGASDVEATGKAIVSYVDMIHRGASKKLRCGFALDCCEPDDVITAVAPDEWGSVAGLDTAGSAATLGTNGPTLPADWLDSPEVLARFREGMPLVEVHAGAMARRLGNPSATRDDLRAFGREGLLDAARAFVEGRGMPFDRWASQRIRNAMIDGVRRSGAVPPRERRRRQAIEAKHPTGHVAERARLSDGQARRESPDTSHWMLLASGLSETPTGPEEGAAGLGVSPEDLLERAQLASLVRELVAKLPKRERALIEQSYFQGLTLEQVAASMGLSRSTAHRVHVRAIETIQREVRLRVGGGDASARAEKVLSTRAARRGEP